MIATTHERTPLPSLAKERWLRASRKCGEATLPRADGVVRSSHRLSFRKLNEPPRPRLSKEGAIYLVARPPLLCQGGELACTTVSSVYTRSEEHTSELQSHNDIVCRILLEKKY